MSIERRYKRVNVSKAKKSKLSEYIKEEDEDEEIPSQNRNETKKLASLSQPILNTNLKKQLNVLLANWKPPLKKTPQNENQNVASQIKNNDSTGDVPQKRKISDAESQISQSLLTLYPRNTQETNGSNVCLADESVSSDLQSDNEQKSQHLDEKTEITNNMSLGNDFSPKPDSKMMQIISCYEDSDKPIIPESKIEDQPTDKIAIENNSKIEHLYFTPPEKIISPQTPPTLKIVRTNPSRTSDPVATESIHLDTSTDAVAMPERKNLLTNTAEENEPESNKGEETKLTKQVEDPLTLNVVNEAESVNKSDTANHLDEEFNISGSLLDSLENNLVHSSSRNVAVETRSSFSTYNQQSFAPKMPQMNWIKQLKEDKRQLQSVVSEVSKLNAMLTRAVREIWPTRQS